MFKVLGFGSVVMETCVQRMPGSNDVEDNGLGGGVGEQDRHSPDT